MSTLLQLTTKCPPEDGGEPARDADADANMDAADPAASPFGGVAAGAAGAKPDWAAVNAQHRSKGLKWLIGKPAGDLIAMRLVMEPFRVLLGNYFDMTSADWEERQQHRLLQASASGGATLASRDYPLAVLAAGELDADFLEKNKIMLQRPQLFACLPRTWLVCSQRAKLFRMISRSGCAVQQMLATEHAGFPFQLFRLIKEPEQAERLRDEIPKCMRDDYTLSIFEAHPTLEGLELRAKLALVGILCWADISKVEARHATVRRLLYASSLQVRTQSLQDLSAQWVFLQHRRRGARLAHRDAKKVRRKVSRGETQTLQHRTVKRSSLPASRLPCDAHPSSPSFPLFAGDEKAQGDGQTTAWEKDEDGETWRFWWKVQGLRSQEDARHEGHVRHA